MDGEPVDLAIEIMPICQTLAAGERLRLGLTLTRADEGSVPATAILDPTTTLLVPRRG